jgi:hypothetical protein
MRTISPRLRLKQKDRIDNVLQFADAMEIRQMVRLPCGCWRVRFASGKAREHNCGAPHCEGMRIQRIKRERERWPRDCACGELRKDGGLVERSAKAAKDGDEALHRRLREARLAHWLECRKERT